MKDTLYIVKSKNTSAILDNMIKEAEQNWSSSIYLLDHDSWDDLKNKKVLFAVELDKIGLSQEIHQFLLRVVTMGDKPFENSVGALLIHGDGELYTKTFGQKLVFDCNCLGMRFIGRPLVEATGSLRNFDTMQKALNLPLEEISRLEAGRLGENLKHFYKGEDRHPNILAIHAGDKTSNTLMLWHMVADFIDSCHLSEIHIENGTVKDCKGCTYKVCKHYGKQAGCFYGGIMVEEVYPAILSADTVVFICPNYNDAISANLSAVINRLTALFRMTKFYDKNLFAVIVSGHSGSDSVAKQLISSLNMNKTFQLPPNFALMEIANDSGDIYKIADIMEKAKNFSQAIIEAPWKI